MVTAILPPGEFSVQLSAAYAPAAEQMRKVDITAKKIQSFFITDNHPFILNNCNYLIALNSCN